MVSIVVPAGSRLQRTGLGQSGRVGLEVDDTCTRAWMLWGSTNMVLILLFILTPVRIFFPPPNQGLYLRLRNRNGSEAEW